MNAQCSTSTIADRVDVRCELTWLRYSMQVNEGMSLAPASICPFSVCITKCVADALRWVIQPEFSREVTTGTSLNTNTSVFRRDWCYRVYAAVLRGFNSVSQCNDFGVGTKLTALGSVVALGAARSAHSARSCRDWPVTDTVQLIANSLFQNYERLKAEHAATRVVFSLRLPTIN